MVYEALLEIYTGSRRVCPQNILELMRPFSGIVCDSILGGVIVAKNTVFHCQPFSFQSANIGSQYLSNQMTSSLVS